jgi:hypothetical protein
MVMYQISVVQTNHGGGTAPSIPNPDEPEPNRKNSPVETRRTQRTQRSLVLPSATHATTNAGLKNGDVEVNQQSHLPTAKLEIGQELCLVNR